MDVILVVNAGSSSLKFSVFAPPTSSEGLRSLIKGQVDGIGSRPRMKARNQNGEVLVDRTYDAGTLSGLPSALQAAGDWLRTGQDLNLIAVGHRVVHGGPRYNRSVRVNSDILSDLERYIPLAPLHQPHNLAPIRSLLRQRPELAQIACFDTAFHREQDALAQHYALPERFYDEGVRRYGFHGLSYEYVAGQVQQTIPNAGDRVIIAHLGSGASMCALKAGRSVESTLGFTALDGLPMGTRPGQLDPGVVLYLLTEKGMSAGEVQALLYNQCGLRGLSGISNDVRELEASEAQTAKFALDYFAYRVGLYSGMLAASLGGLDTFVFTAGIGENSPRMRARIGERIRWLGAAMDPDANSRNATRISDEGSHVGIYVIPTNEELMIARQTVALV